MGYKAVAKELGISHSMVRQWVKRYEQEGIQGLEEKRCKAKGPNKGRPRTRPEDPETKIKRLEAEVEMLKKLLKRGMGKWKQYQPTRSSRSFKKWPGVMVLFNNYVR